MKYKQTKSMQRWHLLPWLTRRRPSLRPQTHEKKNIEIVVNDDVMDYLTIPKIYTHIRLFTFIPPTKQQHQVKMYPLLGKPQEDAFLNS